MERITLTRQQADSLIMHAGRCSPAEACAILIGSGESVTEVFLADNADGSPVSFSIPPEQLIAAYGRAEDMGLGVIGVFHSHPESDAVPSEKDRRFMLANPVTWVIYSGVRREFRAYDAGSDMREIPVEVV